MEYKVIYGEYLDSSYVGDKLYAIDCAVYEEKYWGVPENMVARFERNKKSFVVIEDTPGHPVGYIGFLLTGDALWNDIIKDGDTIRDDDIRPDELLDKFEGDDNKLFVISVVILPDHRGREAVSILTDGFIDYLNKIQEEDNCKITAITGTAVSEDGQKFLKRLNFRFYREVGDLGDNPEDKDIVFLCDGDGIKRLLDHELNLKKK